MHFQHIVAHGPDNSYFRFDCFLIQHSGLTVAAESFFRTTSFTRLLLLQNALETEAGAFSAEFDLIARDPDLSAP